MRRKIRDGNHQREASQRPEATWGKALICLVVLLLLFGWAQCSLPLRTAVQIGADEGFELAKATLCAHGHKLYSEIWNDQPPLHTFLVTQIVRHISHSVLAARLVTTCFTFVLLVSLFYLIRRLAGLAVAVLAVALLIASPGFLELSSSCMLEIPSLALAMAGLCVLAHGHPEKMFPEMGAGLLFGAAILIKLISLVWTPLVALLICHRLMAADSNRASWSGLFASLIAAALKREFIVRVATFTASLLGSATAIDFLIEDGAYFLHFQQTWQSHFTTATSSLYGSAAEHKFDWAILLRNWDTTLPAMVGIWFAVFLGRTRFVGLFSMFWLGWSLVVFSRHTPWWAYYYIHTAIPLCFLAALGIGKLWDDAVTRFRNRARESGNSGRLMRPVVLLVMGLLCAVAWMAGRVCLETKSVNALPRTFSSLVIAESTRYRPFTHWLYADDLALSFHADIPMIPSLAVVPLKRYWAGGMSVEEVAEEFDRYRPEIAILNNSAALVPFRRLLDTNYRLVYQDDRYQLYAITNIIRQAQAE